MENKINNTMSADDILHAWQGVEKAYPGIRIREAAKSLGLSEAQLLATTVGTEATRLTNDWETLLNRLPELGRVMSLTRNEGCVLEHKGPFENVQVMGGPAHKMATVIGPIETRVFLNGWHVAFAATQTKGDRVLKSIQAFDKEGTAITKIYLQDDSNVEAYDKLVADLTSENQERTQEVSEIKKPEYSENPDVESFLNDWGALKDTHDFFQMLRKHKIDRHDAVVKASGKFTTPFAVENLQSLLETAASQKLPIMIFAGNNGNIQIHQDIVRTIRVLERGDDVWLNVLDPNFNMHLRTDLLKDAWVVRKPTTDGDVTSIECFDANGEMIVQFFGLRKPGKPELTEWKELVASYGSASVEA